LFAQVEQATGTFRERLEALESRTKTLEANGVAAQPPTSDASFGYVLQTLQAEVTEAAATAVQALSLAEVAARHPGGIPDSEKVDQLGSDLGKLTQDVRTEFESLRPMLDYPRQLKHVKEVTDQARRGVV
jgi:hypothetical protein